MTGYAENTAIRAGFLGTNMDMITKPFALDSLADKIHRMIALPIKPVAGAPTIVTAGPTIALIRKLAVALSGGLPELVTRTVVGKVPGSGAL